MTKLAQFNQWLEWLILAIACIVLTLEAISVAKTRTRLRQLRSNIQEIRASHPSLEAIEKQDAVDSSER